MSDKPKNQIRQREAYTEDLVKDWFEGCRWAREVEWALDAEQKWEFIKTLVAAAPNDDALGSIGAGPLEDLSSRAGNTPPIAVRLLLAKSDRK
jgi:hypothetical protein